MNRVLSHDEFRRFSPGNDTGDDTVSAIFATTKDLELALLFTLIQEFGRIALSNPAARTEVLESRLIRQEETWCDGFAVEFLTPLSLAATERTVSEVESSEQVL
jgi:hypothetical protein